jgi:hypothetical protein
MSRFRTFRLFDDFDNNDAFFTHAICSHDILHPETMHPVVCRGETIYPTHLLKLNDMGADEISIYRYDIFGREVFDAKGELSV